MQPNRTDPAQSNPTGHQPDYSHLPADCQPLAVILKGADITAAKDALSSDQEMIRFCLERARCQTDSSQAIIDRLTAAKSPDHYRSLARAMLLAAACDTEPLLERYKDDDAVIGAKIAAIELGLDYFAREPAALLAALRDKDPERTRPTGPESTRQVSTAAAQAVDRSFHPLAEGEAFREIFRQLPAPVILAGFGYANCRHMMEMEHNRDDPERRDSLQLAADMWLAVSGNLATAPAAATAG